jgi:transcriptional regulator with XRE-family HTH domain
MRPTGASFSQIRHFLLLETTVITYPIAMISGKQIRAARALLGWKQRELAAAASVSEVSIKNAERGVVDSRGSTLNAIQRAFDRAGVIFLDTGDTRNGGPGVRFKE